MKYQFIRDHASRCRVSSMCRALQVSRSGYYDWYERKPSARDQANTALPVQIRRIHRQSRENYGAVKTWEALNAAGYACGINRVARRNKGDQKQREAETKGNKGDRFISR